MLYSHRQKKLYISALFTITKFVRRRTLFSLFSINRLKLITIGTLVLTIVSASILTSGIAAFLPNNSIVMAAPTTQTNKSLDWKVQSYIYYKALGLCIGNAALSDGGGFFNRINEQNAKTGNWFSKDGGLGVVTHVTVSPYFRSIPGIGSALDSNNATIDCGSPSLVNGALSLWEYDSPADALCDFGFLRVDYDSASLCKGTLGGGKDFYRPGGTLETFQKAIKKQIYDGAEPKMSDSMLYQYYRGIFNQTCTYKKSSITESLTNKAPDYKFGIYDVPDSGKVPTNKSYYVGAMKRSDMVAVLDIKSPTNLKTMSCSDIESEINNLAEAYSDYRLTHSDEPSGPGSATTDKTRVCKLNPELPECKDAGSSCNIPQMGWILCPILTTGAGLADSMYKYMADSFLATDPSIVNSDPNATTENGRLVGTGTYQAWQMMRSFANIAFIIVFLIIIVSQLTSVGIGNFGIKKLLPRLIIAAILVNLSFVVCQIAVDLSNILGYSLKDLMVGIANQVTTEGSQIITGNDGNVAGVLLTGVIVGSLVWINIGAIFVAIIGGLVALLTIFVLLIVRKALIILLVVIAPLAFVAYLLPNTEQLFHKWRKGLTALLMLFPIIGALYGAGALASAIILQVADPNDMVMRITAYIVLVIPLIAAIPVLKGSLSAFGAIGNAINSMGTKAQNAAKQRSQKGYDRSRLAQFKKFKEGERDERRALRQSGVDNRRGGAKNPMNWGSRINKKINEAHIPGELGKFGNKSSVTGVALAADSEKKATAERKILVQKRIADGTMDAQKELEEALSGNDTVRARAIQDWHYEQGSSGVKAVRRAIVAGQNNGTLNNKISKAMRENIATNHGQAIKAKDKAQVLWASGDNSIKLEQHISEAATYAMSASDLSTQTGESLMAAALLGNINPEIANQMLEDPRVNTNLDDEQKAALSEARGGTKQDYIAKKSSLNAEYAQNLATSKERIKSRNQPQNTDSNTQPPAGSTRETITTAAEGTSGTVPFDVNSSGRVTPGTPETRFDVRQEDISRGTESSGDNTFVVDRSGTVTEEEFPNFRIDTENVPPQPRPFSDLNNPPSTTPTPGTPIDPSAIPNLPPNNTPPPNDET